MLIGCRLMGGLGNMCFQIAFGESLSKKYGCEVVYTNLKENFDYIKRNYTRSPYADEYLTVFPNIKWTKNQERLAEIKRVKRVPFHYVDIVPEDGTEYVGYFQSYKYWYSEDFVRWLFSIVSWDSLSMAPAYDRNNCAIHVRRADYLKMPDYHTVLDWNYYYKALDYMDKHGVLKHYIFSDDINWCKEFFEGTPSCFIHNKDYTDFYGMVYCANAIIANSSFSLLAALLNPNPNKVIISPLKEKWFGPKCKDNPQDIIPPNFIQM